MKIAIVAFGLFFIFSIFAEADVKFTYTWKSPEATPVSFAGKKVAVVLVSKNRAPRRAAEEALAKEITKRGAQGIAASELVTESDLKDPALAESRFKEQEIAGVMVIRGTPKGDVKYDPDMWKNPIYKDVWGFTSSSWKSEEAQKQKDIKFVVEIAVYDLAQDELIWMGTTDMKSSELVAFVQNVVDEIAEEMRKAGLLIKKE
jgi:hypothetical protein